MYGLKPVPFKCSTLLFLELWSTGFAVNSVHPRGMEIAQIRPSPILLELNFCSRLRDRMRRPNSMLATNRPTMNKVARTKIGMAVRICNRRRLSSTVRLHDG